MVKVETSNETNLDQADLKTDQFHDLYLRVQELQLHRDILHLQYEIQQLTQALNGDTSRETQDD